MQYQEKLQSIPADILRAADYAILAEKFLPADILAYINGGAGDELSLQQNQKAFDALKILPRALRDFSQANTHCSLLNKRLPHPILLGPVAHQKLVHPDGELATALAAEATDTLMTASTLSSVTLESIACHTNSPKWFQLYWQARREDALTLVNRAEQVGYEAIVLTIDVPVTALRYREQRAGYRQPSDIRPVNLEAFTSQAPVQLETHQSAIFHGLMQQAPCWEDIAWLQQQTRLPILLKGILHPEDAAKACESGVQGIIVSNHGGRSLDTVPASIEMLASIRQRSGKDFTILLDSGIRRGSDIFKALALGADAVLIGRLQVHALAVAGALGVAHMLRLLREELEVTMALAGCPTLADIDSKALLNPEF